MSARRYFRLDMRLRGGGRDLHRTCKVTRLDKVSQRESRCSLVGGELRPQRVRSGKADRIAQTSDEADLELVAVEVGIDVEEVRLDGAAELSKGRPAAKVEHPPEPSVRRVHGHGVDTVGGQELPRRATPHVDRRNADGASATVAAH